MSKLRTKTCARPTFWGLHTAPKSSGHDSIGYLFRVRVRTRAAAARSNTNADIYLLFIWLIAINLALKTQNVFLRRYTSDRHEAKDDVLLTQLFDLNPMIERWSALRCFQCVRCVYANVIETCARERTFEYTADVRFAREGFRIRTAIKRSLSMHCPVDVKKKRILILIDGEWLLLFLRCIARRYFGISPINIPAASAQCVCVRCGAVGLCEWDVPACLAFAAPTNFMHSASINLTVCVRLQLVGCIVVVGSDEHVHFDGSLDGMPDAR